MAATVILLSRDHRIFKGRRFDGESLASIKSHFEHLGLNVSSPVGNSPSQFILFLKGDVPGESTSSNFRNADWHAIGAVFESDPLIWNMYCDLLLGGWCPPTKSFDIFHFGTPGFMASQLAHLVAKGKKRLTAGWNAAMAKAGMNAPVPGGYSVITDGFGIPICCIQTERVEEIKFNEVTEEMAQREGEGDLTLADWKQGHWEYWSSVEAPEVQLEFREDSEIFVEHFRLIKVFSGKQPLDRPKVSMILGLTGSGKTTYSKKLAKERQILHFSIDEWMKTLYWPDAPAEPSLEWALDKCNKCELIIEKMLAQEIARGNGVVLDLGFSKRADREKWRKICESLGADCETIFLDLDRELRWQRVSQRNSSLTAAEASIHVDRGTFDWMEEFFEPLSREELRISKVIQSNS